MLTQPMIRATALALATAVALLFASLLDAQSLTLLHDQDESCTGGHTISQAYEIGYQGFSTQVADDVTVPPDDDWDVTRLHVIGRYFNSPVPTAFLNVTFFADDTGAPGTQIDSCNYVELTSFVDSAGEFTITLPSACQLSGGPLGARYWLAVQARMDLLVNGQWGWQDRLPQTGAAAHWRNPLNGYGTTCGSSWGVRFICVQNDSAAPDQCFALHGSSTQIIFRDGFEGN